jgi:CRISPR-associated exonuclease Cas4
MDAGKEAHEAEQDRAARRTMRQYNVEDGERFFDVGLESPKLELRGILDELVITNSGEHFPVDYKLAKKASHNHRLQLAAYAVLMEEVYQTTVQRGFVYLISTRQMVDVKITPTLREAVEVTLAAMQAMIAGERMPDPTPNRQRCISCEFRRFCNDV